jgi:hypothetical protein
MGLPKKIKKHIPLTEKKTLLGRREELLEKINRDGTYLPKSILHADLDGGMLEFVKNDLKTIVTGKVIPMIDILVTTQNWTQFAQTWDLQNLDKNVEPPFITIVRIPEVKYGTNPSTVYTIPNRRQFFYAQVPTWDGQRNGLDIYKIPQPVPVDITFQVKIVCNRMRELNEFNRIVLEKFSSRQAYTQIKGHYIPIVMGAITDESVSDIEKRKYYVQSYEFTMLGFLINEDEFEVSPAVSRVLQVLEVDLNKTKKQSQNNPINEAKIDALFVTGNYSLTQLFNYKVDLTVGNMNNVKSFDVYINDDYYGHNLNVIQINNDDVLKIDVIKKDDTKDSTIELFETLF